MSIGQEQQIAALAETLRTNQAALERKARGIVRDEAQAEDIVQEVILAVLRAPDMLEGVDSLAGWLTTLVYRRSIDWLRRLKRRPRAIELQDSLSLPLSENNPADENARAEAVMAALDSLPPELESVLRAQLLEGKTFRELSEESGIPMGTLLARKQRALQKLRQTLSREGYAAHNRP